MSLRSRALARRETLWLFVACAVALLAEAAAWGETGDAEVDRGIALYNDLEYEEAAKVLSQAVANPALTVEQKTEGYKTLALAFVALNADDDARAAFRALLAANPSYELPRTDNPKALDLFDEVKKSMPKPAAPPLLRQSASPLNPTPGAAVTVTVTVVDEGNKHASVVVHHRVRGQSAFSTVKATRSAAGRYGAVIPGAFVDAPAVEYYVLALDANGEAVASEGSADEPLLLNVGRDAGAGPAPFYTKWWFWGGVAGAVVTGAVVGIVLLSGGDGGGDDQATVNITVNYMPP